MKGRIIGIVFLVWFFASIVGMFFVVGSENQTEWILILAGQVFLVFGCIGVCASWSERPFPFVILVFPLIGLGCLASGLCMLIGSDVAYIFIVEVTPFLLIALFPIAGLFMILSSVLKILCLKKRCTCEINAKCVDVSSHYMKSNNGGRTKVYMPTYSIVLEGKEYRLCSNEYASKIYTVGEYYKIRVNPNYVYEFIDGNTKMGQGIQLVIGLGFVLLPVIIVIELLT